MTPIERLQTSLNGLGLKAVEARLESLLEQASKKEPSYADFLDELLSCEIDARRSRYLRARRLPPGSATRRAVTGRMAAHQAAAGERVGEFPRPQAP